MRQLWRNLLLFLLPLFMVVCLVLVLHPDGPPNPNGFMGGLPDKHARLQSINGPRLILGGGSNLAFGVNSERLEKAFGMPVVNLGLHGGMGLEFMLGELRHSIRNGDVVLLSIEHQLDMEGQPDLKRYVGELFPESKSYCNPSFPETISLLLGETKEGLEKILSGGLGHNDSTQVENNPVYTRSAFNKYGDVVAHIGQRSFYNPGLVKPFRYEPWKGIEAINSFYDFANESEVKVYYLFPCYPRSNFESNQAALRKITADVKAGIHVPILNSESDFVFADTLFYDTKYHLTGDGRELRTDRMIEILKRKSVIPHTGN
jgi:hypothetical protein